MKSSFIFQCFIFSLLIFSHANGEIIESKDIRDLIKYSNNETLVVLDLNNTLMETAQSLGSDTWAAYVVNQEMEKTGRSKEQILDDFVPIWHKILIASKVIPVENTTSGVIHQLQKNGIKLLGLTARYIELAYPTHEQLGSINIDFSRSTIHHTDIEIEGGYASKFIEGIVFVGLKNDKGETLFRLFNQTNFQPKKILFVDDKLKNIKSVEAAANKRGIPFTGIRYGFTDQKSESFDPSISQKQWEIFKKNLSNNEAIKLLTLSKPELVSGGVK